MIDEGVIKYRLQYRVAGALSDHDYTDLDKWHQQFKLARILGQDPNRYDGLGFGNLSERLDSRAFLISGTQTGNLDKLTADDYARVIRADISKNLVEAEGPVKPSSESLTHAAIYTLDERIKFVFHAHSPEIWTRRESLGIPQTDARIPYGTPEMACEMQRIYEAGAFTDGNILAMAGHEDGIIGFGFDADEAGDVILRYLRIAGGDSTL